MQLAPATEVNACESRLQCNVGSSESLLKDKLKIKRVETSASSITMLELDYSAVTKAGSRRLVSMDSFQLPANISWPGFPTATTLRDNTASFCPLRVWGSVSGFSTRVTFHTPSPTGVWYAARPNKIVAVLVFSTAMTLSSSPAGAPESSGTAAAIALALDFSGLALPWASSGGHPVLEIRSYVSPFTVHGSHIGAIHNHLQETTAASCCSWDIELKASRALYMV
jgi:hypothetical protein